ncbi:MAG: hypothetical protein RIT43_1565, partial [Bacteroidota bacterium]
PDIFVPIDTSANTDYFSDLVQEGHLTSFSLEYVDKNREAIFAKYPTFEDFRKNFTVDKKFMDEFLAYVEKEDKELKFNEEQFKTSENLLKLRMKAVLAQDLWGYSEFYQVYNDSNEILQRAIDVLQKGEYEKTNLDRKN